MKSTLVKVRVDEEMKAKIERIVSETGLWRTPSEFVRDALKKQIDRHWKEAPHDY